MVERPGRALGFTLLELLVVIGIVALLFVFSLPNLDSYIFQDSTKKIASLISTTCRDLKARSRKEGQRFRLEIASDTGQIWVTHDGMDKKEAAAAKEGAFTVPDDVSVTCISGRFATDRNTGVQSILFYPQGYSDPAVIEVREGETTFLVDLQPLLSQAFITQETRL